MESEYASLFLSNFRDAPLPLEVDGPALVRAPAMTTVRDVVEMDAYEGPSTPARCPSFSGVSVPRTPSKPVVAANHATLDNALSASLAEVDSRMASNLDKFFNDDKNWTQVVYEVASSSKLRSPTADFEYDSARVEHAKFKIRVPKPYPGVQYRMTKNLEHRYPRYAKHGSVVTGQVEDGGEWLRISDQVFLPMKVGTIRILEALPPDAPRLSELTLGSLSARLWGCGTGEPESATDTVLAEDPFTSLPGLNHGSGTPSGGTTVAKTDTTQISITAKVGAAAGDGGMVDHVTASLPPVRSRATANGGGAYAERSISESDAFSTKGARRSQIPPPDHGASIFMKVTRKSLPAAVEAGRSSALAERRLSSPALLSSEGMGHIVTDSINPFSDTPPGSRSESPRIAQRTSHSDNSSVF